MRELHDPVDSSRGLTIANYLAKCRQILTAQAGDALSNPLFSRISARVRGLLHPTALRLTANLWLGFLSGRRARLAPAGRSSFLPLIIRPKGALAGRSLNQMNRVVPGLAVVACSLQANAKPATILTAACSTCPGIRLST